MFDWISPDFAVLSYSVNTSDYSALPPAQRLLLKPFDLSGLTLLPWGQTPTTTYDIVFIPNYFNDDVSLKSTQPLLNEKGCLILALTNRLSMAGLSGQSEKRQLFKGITNQNSTDLSYHEVRRHLQEAGFNLIDFYFPFPNHLTPQTIITEKLIDSFPQLAAELCTHQPYYETGTNGIKLFPENILTESITKGNLLKELSNSFLVLASRGPSSTRQKITRLNKRGNTLAWHYSNKRTEPVETIFYLNENSVFVEKHLINYPDKTTFRLKSELLSIEWNAPNEEKILLSQKSHTIFSKLIYNEKLNEAYSFLKDFLIWSFQKWQHPEQISFLNGSAIDALITNSVVSNPSIRNFELFDLEWRCEKPLTKSWFILRNIICLRETLKAHPPVASFRTLKEMYVTLCKEFAIIPDFLEDINLEADFQSLVTSETATQHAEVLSEQFLTPFVYDYFPKDAFKESKLRSDFKQLQLQYEILTAKQNSPFHRLASFTQNLFNHFPRTKKLIKHLLKPTKVETKNILPKKGWVQIDIQTSAPPIDAVLKFKIRGIEFFTTPKTTLPNRIHTLLKLSDDLESIELISKENISISKIKTRQIHKIEAALKLVLPQLPRLLFNSDLRIDFFSRGYTLWKDGKIRGLIAWIHQQSLLGDVCVVDYYSSWITRYDSPTQEQLNSIKIEINTLPYQPLISILMPVYNTDTTWLRSALDSVLAQTYPNWELCIADDKSPLPNVKKVIEEYRIKDPRIKVIYREKNGHISLCSNSALDLANGDFTALLDHDDELSINALYEIVLALNNNRTIDMLYSDEDKMDLRGRRYEPHFKPQWNSELFYSYNVVTHLAVYRTKLLKEIGGFRVGFEGAQDYDLVLRVIEKTNRIHHIPKVLYHWRAIPGSTAGGPSAKKYAYEAARRAISEHFKRIKVDASVSVGINNLNRVQYTLPITLPKVSIIICTKDRADLLKVIVKGCLNDTDYSNVELLIINNQSREEKTLEYFNEIKKDPRVKIFNYDKPFNFSALNNFAAEQATGEYLAFLNNDLKIIHKEWLTEMMRFAVQKKTGAVGAKLYYANDTIQHAGIILGIGRVDGYDHGVAGHSHKGFPKFEHGYMGRLIVNHELSAVTAACLVVKKTTFQIVGGFDALNFAVAFNDVDLCLKLQAAGFVNIFTPYAELYHFESITRGSDQTPENFPRFQKECDTMMLKWKTVLANDPYYSPNLTIDKEDFSLAFPPRVISKDATVTNLSEKSSISYTEVRPNLLVKQAEYDL